MLTNQSPHLLSHFDPNVTYVVGAIVDLSPKGPLMLAKAKELNIQTARLPFELFRRVRMRKNIPLNQYLDILLEFKYSSNWDKAFNCLSQRFFK